MTLKIFLSLILVISPLLTIFNSKTYAAEGETYYLKGAAYNSTLVRDTGQISSRNSAVAATAYASAAGKITVRGWTRDSIVKDHYNASDVVTRHLELYVSSPASIQNFIQPNSVLPKQTGNNGLWVGDIIGFKWWLPLIGNGVQAIVQGARGKVQHTIGSNNHYALVRYADINNRSAELPSSVSYRDADVYSHNRSSGKHMNVVLNLPSNGASVNTYAKAYYTVSVNPGFPTPPSTFGVRTGNATIPFTVGR